MKESRNFLEDFWRRLLSSDRGETQASSGFPCCCWKCPLTVALWLCRDDWIVLGCLTLSLASAHLWTKNGTVLALSVAKPYTGFCADSVRGRGESFRIWNMTTLSGPCFFYQRWKLRGGWYISELIDNWILLSLQKCTGLFLPISSLCPINICWASAKSLKCPISTAWIYS